MWSIKLSLFACVLSLGSCQDILFRSSIPGRVSHHTKTVTDGVSTVHRHQTHATSPRVQLVQAPLVEPVLRRQSASEPVLLQHADGRFFALNANLQPGQFFQTSDGRIFTLRASSTGASRNRISDTQEATRERTVENTSTEAPETTTEAVTTTTTTSATTTTPEPTTEMPVVEDSETSGRVIEDDSTRQVEANIIATAPLTPSTARFVGASTPQHFNTFHSIDHPFVHAAFPVARGNVQQQTAQNQLLNNAVRSQLLNQAVPNQVIGHDAPVLRSSVPVIRFQNHNAGHTQQEFRVDDLGNHAVVRTHEHNVPTSSVILSAAPNAAFIRRRNPFASSSSAFARFQAVPSPLAANVVAAPVTQVAAAPLVQVSAAPQAAIAARGHQLADSATSVFQGFYSFPSVGIDFDF